MSNRNPMPDDIWVHATGPIDNWDDWRPLLDGEYEALHAVACDLARMIGWEGDSHGHHSIDDGDLVFVPELGVFVLGPAVAWKQQNNGTTFIAGTHKAAQLDGPWAHAQCLNPAAMGSPDGDVYRIDLAGRLDRIQVPWAGASSHAEGDSK